MGHWSLLPHLLVYTIMYLHEYGLMGYLFHMLGYSPMAFQTGPVLAIGISFRLASVSL